MTSKETDVTANTATAKPMPMSHALKTFFTGDADDLHDLHRSCHRGAPIIFIRGSAGFVDVETLPPDPRVRNAQVARLRRAGSKSITEAGIGAGEIAAAIAHEPKFLYGSIGSTPGDKFVSALRRELRCVTQGKCTPVESIPIFDAETSLRASKLRADVIPLYQALDSKTIAPAHIESLRDTLKIPAATTVIDIHSEQLLYPFVSLLYSSIQDEPRDTDTGPNTETIFRMRMLLALVNILACEAFPYLTAASRMSVYYQPHIGTDTYSLVLIAVPV